MTATAITQEDERVRLILANRMAEIQATPGVPDRAKETRIDTGFGEVILTQKTVPAGLKNEEDAELGGINRVRLTVQWSHSGAQQTRSVEFYVYRA
jgi:hypothetical protein